MTEDENSPDQNPEGQETESSSQPSIPQRYIGPYRILQTLGEGGMGTVYLADQQKPFRRRVALKVIKLGMDSQQVLARFESERQALAILNHPNIAKVFDAGVTEQGRSYFVMEYVSGLPINTFCDERRLNLRERLKLFGDACDAMQHAHRNGIIHRDIKPSNILVSVQDDNPAVKVIDFGLAKATSRRLTDQSLYTQHGVLIGTPEYMSPEQAGTTALDVDSRTDIYSLGVVLYELLVGALPFDPATLRQAAGLEMLRIIREVDPPKPTTRISSLGDEAREVALRRHTNVGALTKLVRGELEWITMRALEKDPARRYPSAQELASDVRRFLSDEPVLARRPSVAYRIRKLVRRRKTGVIGVGTVVALLVIGLVAGVTAHSRAEAGKDAALRWTMEQLIDKGVDPAAIQPNWSELANRMRANNRANPTGELAALSLRAVAQIRVTAPSFGLRSSLPAVEITGSARMQGAIDPGIPYLYMTEVDGSWDGAPWKAISTGWVLWIPGDPRSSFDRFVAPLGSFLDPAQLTSAPHHLKLRVHYKWIKPDDNALHTGTLSSKVLFPQWNPEELSLDAFAGPILFSDTRELDPLPMSLFDEYPENFPTQMQVSAATGPLDKWFRLDKIRLVRVTPPAEALSGEICFVQRGCGRPELCLDVASNEIPAAGPVVEGVEMEGRMIEQTPLPIAAQAVLRDAGTGQPHFEFPLAFGLGTQVMSMPGVRGGGVSCIENGAITFLSRFVSAAHITIPSSESEHSFQGSLELTPSREVALSARRFDHYLGSVISIPVEVEVLTVQGFARKEDLDRSRREKK